MSATSSPVPPLLAPVSTPQPTQSSTVAMQSTDKLKSGTTWDNLPSEIILHVVASTEYFEFATIHNLQLVDQRLYRILKAYERSLCKGYVTNQLRHVVAYFPDLISPQCKACRSVVGCTCNLSFSLLANIQHSVQLLTELHRDVFELAPVCRCLQSWHTLFKAGVLFLFRMQGLSSYDEKADFIFSMPVGCLVAVLIALTQSLRAVQMGGSGLIHQDALPDDAQSRSDVLLVFEDCILRGGPEVVMGTLNHNEWAENMLERQYSRLDESQMADEDGTPPQKSLISQLKRAFAFKAGCRIGGIMTKAMEMSQKKPLRDITDAYIVNLVQSVPEY
ncbi:uncharacterized protein BKCO1_6000188 [Diplodia corticola]|uniref:F-box domain-containing protein n=1 Tax=Diplodia corticola TaxID=236234 RepID=A0A1J9SD27_9PEZI|nr:uncharacterized protein BKCO1_6000188 [Diplodia corticola]OJD37756.1 hypothetical protein BKCO1_6000188 [Diplodia corticola]